MFRRRKDRCPLPNAVLCPVCKVGTLKPVGPPFPDTSATAGKIKEFKITYACDECAFSETRNAEPTNIDDATDTDRGEGEE